MKTPPSRVVNLVKRRIVVRRNHTRQFQRLKHPLSVLSALSCPIDMAQHIKHRLSLVLGHGQRVVHLCTMPYLRLSHQLSSRSNRESKDSSMSARYSRMSLGPVLLGPRCQVDTISSRSRTVSRVCLHSTVTRPPRYRCQQAAEPLPQPGHGQSPLPYRLTPSPC